MDNINKIGKYAIEAELGKGAMGVVYKGFDPVINRHVAIKTTSRQNADDTALLARFRQEAQAAGRLNHPGIVSVYEFGEDGELSFIAMELVTGCTLADLARENVRLPYRDAAQLMIRILDALDYAHKNGVVHRDIKPSNIMCGADGAVKITDFGIARLDSSDLTATGAVIGTPGYMAPEQLLGQPVDFRSDIFSCGVLFYELLTGERAFAGNNVTSVLYKIAHTELPRASRICPTLPEAFDAVLAKALAKRPEARYESAGVFADAIRAIVPEAPLSMDYPFIARLTDDKTLPTTPAPAGAGPAATDNLTVHMARQGMQAGEGVQDRPAKRIPVSDTRVQEAPIGSLPADNADRATSRFSRRWSSLAALILVISGVSFFIWHFLFADAPEPRERAMETVGPIEAPLLPSGDRFKDCEACPEMIVIPPGIFDQGSPVSEAGRDANEGPRHPVRLDYPLAVAQFEVTRAQFAQFVSETGYEAAGCTTYEEGRWLLREKRSWRSPGFEQTEAEPVTCVSWEDASRYTRWLSEKTQRTYRLLSASEWEYVARAGSDTARAWGDAPEDACRVTNVADKAALSAYPGWAVHDCMDGHVHTASMKGLKPNAFGVYATLGNVFEWVEDCWNADYRGAPDNGSPWTQGDCDKRVLRGGSWFSQPSFVRSAYRNRFEAATRASTFGIRVARELAGE